ncbi:MAG: putative hydrolase of the superfamily [Frankiales bacterium]|jgi:putative hydrolase of the HAD superfamily|nr:putative hydrolase of the superfamily [Frankiales bacterium]
MAELRAVTVDLDDTLFPQSSWLAGAWGAVAAVAEAFGFDRVSFRADLVSFAAEGSDKGGIIDRALLAAGVDDPAPLLPALVSAFSGWAPSVLALYPGASEALVRLRSAGLSLAIVTDGNPQIQRSKLTALRLDELVDHVVISDELGGRASRKPSPVPFLRALELCGTCASDTVHVGDRPAKDVAGAAAAGMRAVRVRTGEYSETPDRTGDPAPWATAGTFAEAVDLILS